MVDSRQMRSSSLRSRLEIGIERVHGHHHRGRSAGKIQTLLEIRHPHHVRLQMRRQRFLIAQRLHVVFVVVGDGAELLVAGLLEQILGGDIVATHFQAHGGAILILRQFLYGLQQTQTDAATAPGRLDRQRVES